MTIRFRSFGRIIANILSAAWKHFFIDADKGVITLFYLAVRSRFFGCAKNWVEKFRIYGLSREGEKKADENEAEKEYCMGLCIRAFICCAHNFFLLFISWKLTIYNVQSATRTKVQGIIIRWDRRNIYVTLVYCGLLLVRGSVSVYATGQCIVNRTRL